MEPIEDLKFDPLFEWAFSEVSNRAELDALLGDADEAPPELARDD